MKKVAKQVNLTSSCKLLIRFNGLLLIFLRSTLVHFCQDSTWEVAANTRGLGCKSRREFSPVVVGWSGLGFLYPCGTGLVIAVSLSQMITKAQPE